MDSITLQQSSHCSPVTLCIHTEAEHHHRKSKKQEMFSRSFHFIYKCKWNYSMPTCNSYKIWHSTPAEVQGNYSFFHAISACPPDMRHSQSSGNHASFHFPHLAAPFAGLQLVPLLQSAQRDSCSSSECGTPPSIMFRKQQHPDIVCALCETHIAYNRLSHSSTGRYSCI